MGTTGRTVCYPVSVVAMDQRIAGSGPQAVVGPFDGAKVRERRAEGEGIAAYGRWAEESGGRRSGRGRGGGHGPGLFSAVHMISYARMFARCSILDAIRSGWLLLLFLRWSQTRVLNAQKLDYRRALADRGNRGNRWAVR